MIRRAMTGVPSSGHRRQATLCPKRKNPTKAVSLLLAFFWLSINGHAPLAQTLNCDSDFVRFLGVAIEVLPTGSNDADNIECALREASRLDSRLVTLRASSYRVERPISVVNFRGNIEGVTRASTTIEFAERSFDCAVYDSSRFDFSGSFVVDTANGLTFEQGVPGVRFLTMRAGRPCSSGNAFGMIAFRPSSGDCDQRTFFALVDRIDFEGSATSNQLIESVSATSTAAPPCSLPPTGTLKVNQSTFTDIFSALGVSMVGGAQVDVNFNTFTNLVIPIQIANANQNTTIVGNTFDMGSEGIQGVQGAISIGTFPGVSSPAMNRTVIHANTFFDRGTTTLGAFFVGHSARGTRQDSSFVITQNIFDMRGPAESVAVVILETNSGVIQNNSFRGNADVGIILGREDGSNATVADWSIVGNDFTGFNSRDSDMFFGPGTTGNVFGPNQTSSITGRGNNVFP